jgi:hypothetical protein
MRRVLEVERDTEDEVENEVEVAEEDEEEKERRIEAAHTAEGTTTLPKTAGSVKRSKTNNNISNQVNVLGTPILTMKLSAIIAEKPVTCATNVN